MLRVNNLIGFGGRTEAGGATDPSFASVVLLMGFEGVNGATSGAGFTDESTFNPKAEGGLNAAGPTITTSQFRFNTSALDLTGTGGLGWADSADFNLSTGLFTVEASIRPDTVSGVRVICGQWGPSNQGWVLAQSGDTLIWRVSTTGSNSFTDLTSASLFSTATWYEVAVDFDGTTYRLYINGTVVATSTTLRTIFNSAYAFEVGNSSTGGGVLQEKFDGTLDELRITKGVARYAGAYTPAVTAFPRS